ncbi:MAG TPA: hypothetical protein VH619_13785 [Verrucomicrobiae bacterium]|jgi:hypothetical protein|nr:hypothetical protein [Verrucomicrobiae bacterium]
MSYARAASVLLMVLAVSAAANETYVWTGGMPGFSGTITLDSSASPSGGGTMADIVSAQVTVPVGGFFGSQEYTFNFDPFTATSYGAFTWNAEDITGMEIRWQDIPSFVNNPNMGNNYLGDYNSNGGEAMEDYTGSWEASNPIAVQDGESTAAMLAVATVVLGCWGVRMKKCL